MPCPIGGRCYFMDKKMSKKTEKPKPLNGCYRLDECLFDNELGQLYHAHDVRHSRNTPGSHVLIHLFPADAISYHALSTTFKRLKNKIKKLNHPVLNVLDYGWDDSGAYFIMETPDSWSMNVLPKLCGQPGNLHRQAIQISNALRTSGHINHGLIPQAFLVIPGGIRLLGTALTEFFQKTQPQNQLLPAAFTDHSRRRAKFIPVALGMSVLGGIAVAGGSYFYNSTRESVSAKSTATELSTSLSSAEIIPDETSPSHTTADPVTIIAKADIPQIDESIIPEMTEPEPAKKNIEVTEKQGKTAQQTPVAAPNNPAETIPEPTEPITRTQATETAKPEPAEARSVKTEPVEPELAKTKPTEAESAKTELTEPKSTEAESAKTASTEPEKSTEDSDKKPATRQHQPKINPAKLTANGMNQTELIERAYAAIENGSLSEHPGSGSVYYIRLLKRIAPRHLQIHRLSREVVSAYHVKARAALQEKDKHKARHHLWMAGRLIEEFKLTQMRQAQLILERRSKE